MRQQSEKICPTCIGTGGEVRRITNPLSNVFGWHLIDVMDSLYSRVCERCNGTGFIPVISGSVPVIPKQTESNPQQ